jgi:hypothetical protein
MILQHFVNESEIEQFYNGRFSSLTSHSHSPLHKDIIAQKVHSSLTTFFSCGYRVLTFSLFPIYLYDSILMFAQHQQVRQFMDKKK